MDNPCSSLKNSLLKAHVVVKIPGWSRALGATVFAVDETGFWFTGDEMMVALREMCGEPVTRVKSPTIFVPFSNIEWILASDPRPVAVAE